MGVEHKLKPNIWVAASDGDLQRVKELVETHNVNIQDEHGYSPLHAAASYNHTELIEYLISIGANINIRDEDGDTPLHVCEEIQAAMILLKNGASPLLENYKGRNAIDVCNEDERYRLATFLQVYVDENQDFDAALEKAQQYGVDLVQDEERAEKFIEIMDRLIKEEMVNLTEDRFSETKDCEK